MAIKFNPFTGNFDFVGTSSGSPSPVSISNHTILGSIRVLQDSNFSINAAVGVTIKQAASLYAQIFGSVKAFSASEVRCEAGSALRIKAV